MTSDLPSFLPAAEPLWHVARTPTGEYDFEGYAVYVLDAAMIGGKRTVVRPLEEADAVQIVRDHNEAPRMRHALETAPACEPGVGEADGWTEIADVRPLLNHRHAQVLPMVVADNSYSLPASGDSARTHILALTLTIPLPFSRRGSNTSRESLA